MAAPNPLADSGSGGPAASVSRKRFTIAGIVTTVHGLDEVPPHVAEVACLWLLHPRLMTQECMDPMAASTILGWNAVLSEKGGEAPQRGLIAVSFDQRNHGTRQVSPLANEAWRSGNPTHAQDMFSTYHGTAMDTSLLMDYLSSYLFPLSDRAIVDHLVMGISLGGHAAWQLLLLEPRISTAVVGIGCPDYTRLMMDRAAKSKLQTWTRSATPGEDFLGSNDFPRGLMGAVEKWDPARRLMGGLDEGDVENPSEKQREQLRPLMRNFLQDRRILILSGAADKLVPYRCSAPFLHFLGKALDRDGGWTVDGEVRLTDRVFEGVGHEMNAEMRAEALSFIVEAMASSSKSSQSAGYSPSGRDSKM